MKRIATLITLVFCACSITVSGQDIKTPKKEADAKVEQIKKDGQDVKKDAKDRADKMKEDAKDEVNTLTSDAEATKAEYEAKLKQAGSEEEVKEIKDEMEEAVGNAKSDAEAEVKDAKDGVKNEMKDGVTRGEAVKDEAKLKGKDWGKKRVSDAQANIDKKTDQLTAKEEMVKNGRLRVAAAKEKISTMLEKGEITQAQYDEKAASIKRVELNLDKLENSINEGKSTYQRQKETLSKVYQDGN